MKNETIMKWVIALIFVLSLILAYAIWNYSTRSYQRKNNQMALNLAILNDSLQRKFNILIDSTRFIDSTAQHILFIGDSMAEGLRYPFFQYAKFNRHKLTVIAKTSATIVSWAGKNGEGRLKQTMKEIKPSYVIISLGSNELFTKGLTLYKKYIDSIVAQLGKSKFIWIAPPNWKEDNGLTEIIKKGVGERRFFPSKKLKLERAGDGIHPTVKGYEIWTDSIASWIMQKSLYKIVLAKPVEEAP